MKKQISAILAAMVLTVGAQGMASAAPIAAMGADSRELVLLDDEYYIDDPDAQVGDVYVDVDTGEEYEVVE